MSATKVETLAEGKLNSSETPSQNGCDTKNNGKECTVNKIKNNIVDNNDKPSTNVVVNKTVDLNEEIILNSGDNSLVVNKCTNGDISIADDFNTCKSIKNCAELGGNTTIVSSDLENSSSDKVRKESMVNSECMGEVTKEKREDTVKNNDNERIVITPTECKSNSDVIKKDSKTVKNNEDERIVNKPTECESKSNCDVIKKDSKDTNGTNENEQIVNNSVPAECESKNSSDCKDTVENNANTTETTVENEINAKETPQEEEQNKEDNEIPEKNDSTESNAILADSSSPVNEQSEVEAMDVDESSIPTTVVSEDNGKTNESLTTKDDTAIEKEAIELTETNTTLNEKQHDHLTTTKDDTKNEKDPVEVTTSVASDDTIIDKNITDESATTKDDNPTNESSDHDVIADKIKMDTCNKENASDEASAVDAQEIVQINNTPSEKESLNKDVKEDSCSNAENNTVKSVSDVEMTEQNLNKIIPGSSENQSSANINNKEENNLKKDTVSKNEEVNQKKSEKCLTKRPIEEVNSEENVKKMKLSNDKSRSNDRTNKKDIRRRKSMEENKFNSLNVKKKIRLSVDSKDIKETEPQCDIIIDGIVRDSIEDKLVEKSDKKYDNFKHLSKKKVKNMKLVNKDKDKKDILKKIKDKKDGSMVKTTKVVAEEKSEAKEKKTEGKDKKTEAKEKKTEDKQIKSESKEKEGESKTIKSEANLKTESENIKSVKLDKIKLKKKKKSVNEVVEYELMNSNLKQTTCPFCNCDFKHNNKKILGEKSKSFMDIVPGDSVNINVGKLEGLVTQILVDWATNKCDVGVLRKKVHFLGEEHDRLVQLTLHLKKQLDDAKCIIKRMIDEKVALKSWGDAITPLKVTRSVGMQICTTGSAHVLIKPPDDKESTSQGRISNSGKDSENKRHSYVEIVKENGRTIGKIKETSPRIISATTSGTQPAIVGISGNKEARSSNGPTFAVGADQRVKAGSKQIEDDPEIQVIESPTKQKPATTITNQTAGNVVAQPVKTAGTVPTTIPATTPTTQAIYVLNTNVNTITSNNFNDNVRQVLPPSQQSQQAPSTSTGSSTAPSASTSKKISSEIIDLTDNDPVGWQEPKNKVPPTKNNTPRSSNLPALARVQSNVSAVTTIAGSAKQQPTVATVAARQQPTVATVAARQQPTVATVAARQQPTVAGAPARQQQPNLAPNPARQKSAVVAPAVRQQPATAATSSSQQTTVVASPSSDKQQSAVADQTTTKPATVNTVPTSNSPNKVVTFPADSTTASVVQKSTNSVPKPIPRSTMAAKPDVIPITENLLTSMTTLPPLPRSPRYPTNVLKPPKPVLRICKNTEVGIMLSWNFEEHIPTAIRKYQVYAYQESTTVDVTKTDMWKKVGDVDALPLPMACTLTQFKEGHKYFFIVRAVDIHTRVGEFSLPGSIMLTDTVEEAS